MRHEAGANINATVAKCTHIRITLNAAQGCGANITR
jgi:hypothetical protein